MAMAVAAAVILVGAVAAILAAAVAVLAVVFQAAMRLQLRGQASVAGQVFKTTRALQTELQ